MNPWVIVKNNKTYNPRECTQWMRRREWVERKELGLRKSRLWGKTVTRGALHPHNTSHREDKWYLSNIRCSFWFSIMASWTGSAMTNSLTKEPRTSSNSMAASRMYPVPLLTKKSSVPSKDFVTLSGVILLRFTLSRKYLRVPTSLRDSALYKWSNTSCKWILARRGINMVKLTHCYLCQIMFLKLHLLY